MDWGEVFWRLHAQWPMYFAADTFENIPLHIVEDALVALHRLESLQAARFGDAIAVLTAGFFRANGAKRVDSLDLNPHRRMVAIAEARERVPAGVARLCLRLIGEGKLPDWALERLDPTMQTLTLAATVEG